MKRLTRSFAVGLRAAATSTSELVDDICYIVRDGGAA